MLLVVLWRVTVLSGMFGQGIYFAEDAYYSHNDYGHTLSRDEGGDGKQKVLLYTSAFGSSVEVRVKEGSYSCVALLLTSTLVLEI